MADEKPLNEVTLRQWSNRYNEATRKAHVVREIYASFYNHATIIEAFKSGRAFDLKKHHKTSGPVLIIGSGPTLDESIERIIEFDGGVMCSTSQAVTLVKHGVVPDYIMATDPMSNWGEIKRVPHNWGDLRTKRGRVPAVITHPGVDRSLIENWPGELVMFRQNVNTTPFYTNAQKIGYSNWEGDIVRLYIETLLTMFSCAGAAQILAARGLGYQSQYLLGLDFSCPGGRPRFTEWTWKEGGAGEPGGWVEKPTTKTVEEGWGKPGNAETYTASGIPTMPIHMFYKKNFASAWRIDCSDIYNVGDGALEEWPQTTMDEIIRTQGKRVKWFLKEPGGKRKRGHGTFGVKQRIEASENYLATQDLYVLTGEEGYQFVESPDPEESMPVYMARHNALIRCPKCQWHGTMRPQEGMAMPPLEKIPCPRCKQEEVLEKPPPFDIPSNLTRFRKRIAHAKKYREWYAKEKGGEDQDKIVTPGNMTALGIDGEVTGITVQEDVDIKR